MKILLDTNILSRIAEPGHRMHQEAEDAIKALRAQGHTLCIVPQNFYEFWSVCTRPLAANGLGKTSAEAATELARIRAGFTLIDDVPAILPTWESLVASHGIVGKNAHDARLVAAMLVHGISHLLTFNDKDFRSYPITVWTPDDVLAPPPPVAPAPLPPPPP